MNTRHDDKCSLTNFIGPIDWNNLRRRIVITLPFTDERNEAQSS